MPISEGESKIFFGHLQKVGISQYAILNAWLLARRWLSSGAAGPKKTHKAMKAIIGHFILRNVR
jgi:hypothetical protein